MGGRTLEWSNSFRRRRRSITLLRRTFTNDAFWEMKEKGVKRTNSLDSARRDSYAENKRCRYCYRRLRDGIWLRHDLAYLVAGDSGLRRHDHQLDCKSFDEDVDYYVPVRSRKLKPAFPMRLFQGRAENGN